MNIEQGKNFDWKNPDQEFQATLWFALIWKPKSYHIHVPPIIKRVKSYKFGIWTTYISTKLNIFSFSFPAVQQPIEVTVAVLLCKECDKYCIKETTLSKHLRKVHRSILVTSPQSSGHRRSHAEDKLLLLNIFSEHYWTISFVLLSSCSAVLSWLWEQHDKILILILEGGTESRIIAG